MMMNKIDASIIIPVYNNFEIFKKIFRAILGQNYQKDKYEIIIVDDGSTDGISEFFQKKGDPSGSPSFINAFYQRVTCIRRAY